MNTNQIKRFACEARNILKKGIKAKIQTLGYNEKGQVPESLMPQLLQGGTLWNGKQYPEGFYHQWMALYHRVAEKGIQEVYEEAAYIWFNRLMAIRILQKNGFCEPVLVYIDDARTPRIVNEARLGRIPEMSEESRRHLMDLLDDDTKVTDQFAVLISAWCHQNPIIQACFGRMEDFTELLLPINILAEGGFVDMINHTEFITDDDFHSPELIGWLYQFYISERKDEVFAKKGKFEADEIPAATQIFTPNWIVKYMVQNTVGRIYLDNNPGTTAFEDKWEYLVQTAEPTPPESIYHYEELTDLKVGDLACGSGHILNECFDLLYDLYVYEGYSRSEAVENIFSKNLTGIDLDNRAKQLSMFSLMVKACQKDATFVDAHCLPRVLTMPKALEEIKTDEGVEVAMLQEHIRYFCQGEGTTACYKELKAAFELMQNADSLGSIMKFDISQTTRLLIEQMIAYLEEQKYLNDTIVHELMPGMKLILALTTNYSALVMNPPYMGGGNMNEVLSRYVKKNYEIGKADLATVFVQHMAEITFHNAKYAFIIPPSWMFLSTFENLRRDIIDNRSIDSLLHLSRGVFGADFGASSAVITNAENKNAMGTYFRLIERTFQEFDQKHLQLLFEKTLANHDFKFYFADYTKEVADIVYSEKGAKIYYPSIPQANFEKIPGCPIGYWVSDNVMHIFENNLKLSSIYDVKKGIDTGKNETFVRLWPEISTKKFSSWNKSLKWYPYIKGGTFRKWYGNFELAVNWENDGKEIKVHPSSTIRNPSYMKKKAITWSLTCCNNTFGARFVPHNCLFDNNGSSVFPNSNTEDIISYLNSKPATLFLNVENPTIAFQVGNIASLPYINNHNKTNIIIVNENISISKEDWDAHETSWDFQTNELLAIDESIYMENIHNDVEEHFKETGEHICIDSAAPQLDSLEWRVEQYKNKWEHKFHQLHANEEELNRQFIEIYGLQDELTPDVPLSEITILQQGEISIERVDAKDENNL